MTRTRHDEWVKRSMSLWFDALGDVRLDARIAGETRHGDVLFTERRRSAAAARRRTLGMLGKLARGRVLFEPFRNPVTALEIRTSVLKVIDLEAQDARAARRAGKKLSTVPQTMACIISPGLSEKVRAEVGAVNEPEHGPGFYRLAAVWRGAIVAVHELPDDASTLWLRLLGRGEVQAAAVRELYARAEQDPLKDATVELLVAWQQSLPPPAERSEDEQELAMNLEQIYDRWEKKTRALGKAEGKAEAVLDVLAGRGLAVTAAQRRQVLACADEARLVAWLRAAATAPSVEALLASTRPRPRGK